MTSDTNDGFSPKRFNNRILERNGELGVAACKIMAAAVNAVNPYQCIVDHINCSGQTMQIGNQTLELDQFNRVFLIGFGKASVPMAKAIIDILEDKIVDAKVITKSQSFLKQDGYKQKLRVLLGGHPIPTDESLESTKKILSSLPTLKEDDLVLVVISGGGSALFTQPIDGVSIQDIQKMTEVLLRCGADIYEINTLRKHVDLVKGGHLALRLQPACVHSLILSDVVGDRLDMIASGPTAPDPTTCEDALRIIDKYGIKGDLPQSIIRSLEIGREKANTDTEKRSQNQIDRLHHHLIGTNMIAAGAAKLQAEALGFNSLVISSHLTGLTKDVSKFLEGIIQTELAFDQPVPKPACLIFGGETTVEIQGSGQGGRNQDLVLRMVRSLATSSGVLFISLATDGEDGTTDAAGAASDALVFRDGAVLLKSDIDTYIKTSNSYQYFKEVGGLIKTGSTGTNVNDLAIILLNPEDRN